MRKLLILTMALIAWVSCSGPVNVNADVEAANMQFDLGHYDRAEGIVDQIMSDTAAFGQLSVKSLCTLAGLCVRIDSAGAQEPDRCEAYAARCLVRAYELSPDSVEAFMASFPVERATRIEVITHASRYLSVPRDSLFVDDENAADTIM